MSIMILRAKRCCVSLAIVALFHLSAFYGSMSAACRHPVELWSPWNGNAYLHLPPLDSELTRVSP